MSNYPSKTFKVHPTYRLLYQCCIDVLNVQKTSLTQALLESKFGMEEADKFQQYRFNELFQKMLSDFKESVHKTSFQYLVSTIQSHERLISVRHLANAVVHENNLVMLSFRIPEHVVEDVYDLKVHTMGEVVEMTIAYFITTCNEEVFELIILSFKTSLRKYPII